MARVAALVLAAGLSRRFGSETEGSKVTALLDGVSLVRRVAAAAIGSRASPVVVVTGRAAATIDEELAGLPVRVLHNPDYETGMASSLKAGVAALPPDVDGALILLADMPLVSPTSLDQLIGWFESGPDIDAVIPTFQGRAGNPVLIGRGIFRSLGGLTGDEGARKLLRAAGRRTVSCAVDDEGVLIDVDAPETLRTLEDRLRALGR